MLYVILDDIIHIQKNFMLLLQLWMTAHGGKYKKIPCDALLPALKCKMLVSNAYSNCRRHTVIRATWIHMGYFTVHAVFSITFSGFNPLLSCLIWQQYVSQKQFIRWHLLFNICCVFVYREMHYGLLICIFFYSVYLRFEVYSLDKT